MMKHFPLKHTIIGATVSCCFAVPTLLMAVPLTTDQKASYAIGFKYVQSLKDQGIKLDAENLTQGIKDAYSGKAVLSNDEMKNAYNDFMAQLVKQKEQQQNTLAEKNQQLGDDFLTQNKAKEGVTTLASGLQYKVLKSGNGSTPKASDKVTTHYRGTLIDGTEFDSSYSRLKPATFPVSGVIKGWTEALQLMKVGDKWQLFIPADLAYGKRAVGKVIKPNSTLIFEIELLGINQ